MATTINEATTLQYDHIITICRELFIHKTTDYGTSWRILRQSSLTDQIFIKAQRIRTIEEIGSSKIDEAITSEYIGIINYCVIALIQMELTANDSMEMSVNEVSNLYDAEVTETKKLMLDKNHDYGEAWRDMRVSSLTDLILMKLLRVKQIEDNKGKTLVSEGIDANFRDMINYAVFALIRLKEIS